MKPSIGRIVHVVADNGTHLAAIICEIKNAPRVVVGLQVFQATGRYHHIVSGEFEDDSPFIGPWFAQDEDQKLPGTWHWPEKVD